MHLIFNFRKDFPALRKRPEAWDCDASWHMGIRRRRLWLLNWLRPLDLYASHALEPSRIFAPDGESADLCDLDDCVARIRHYLDHPDETRAISEAAHRRAMSNHTYERRAQSLLATIGEWKGRHGKR